MNYDEYSSDDTFKEELLIEADISRASSYLKLRQERASSTPLRLARGYSNTERDDSYRGVLFYIDETWRVTVCKDGYQYVLQQREAQDHWEGRKFYARKDHLARGITDTLGDDAFGLIQSQVEALRI